MKSVYRALDTVRDYVRACMRAIARPIDRLTGGKLTPGMVTITGLLLHAPIAYLIATGHVRWAALMLVFFGLFDAFDGALATVQDKVSNAGMLLDASTDRVKEVLLYAGAAYHFVEIGRPHMTVWAVLACGASLCVSYIKAKGETAVAGGKLTANEVNRLFQDGLGRFEVRMFLLIIGLISDRLVLAVIVIALLSSLTAVERLVKISRKLA